MLMYTGGRCKPPTGKPRSATPQATQCPRRQWAGSTTKCASLRHRTTKAYASDSAARRLWGRTSNAVRRRLLHRCIQRRQASAPPPKRFDVGTPLHTTFKEVSAATKSVPRNTMLKRPRTTAACGWCIRKGLPGASEQSSAVPSHTSAVNELREVVWILWGWGPRVRKGWVPRPAMKRERGAGHESRFQAQSRHDCSTSAGSRWAEGKGWEGGPLCQAARGRI